MGGKEAEMTVDLALEARASTRSATRSCIELASPA